jgi:CRISPR-associated endonuclease/helicase Cas3
VTVDLDQKTGNMTLAWSGDQKTLSRLVLISPADQRVFYTLPTITTISAMYQRLTDKAKGYGLDVDTVAEYFSGIDLYLDLEGTGPKRANLNLYRTFFYPVNVTTPDQLILAIMNHRRYTLKSLMMRRSLVVFDEIHAYDSETFGLIKSLIKHCHKHYDAKFCIMSATFPNRLKKELRFLKAKELLSRGMVYAEYKRRRRTGVQFNNRYIRQDLELLYDYYAKRSKVLLVTNTVSRAQNLFTRLQELMIDKGSPLSDLMLIHSRYTFADRREHEKRLLQPEHSLRKPSILVATQIIEVSLDIDYDVMFTEACYPDSLVQRAGRINRRGNLGNMAKAWLWFTCRKTGSLIGKGRACLTIWNFCEIPYL